MSGERALVVGRRVRAQIERLADLYRSRWSEESSAAITNRVEHFNTLTRHQKKKEEQLSQLVATMSTRALRRRGNWLLKLSGQKCLFC
jgi:hypothetical protein